MAHDSENARKEMAQMLADKRASPAGSVVRKQFGFWSTLDDLNLNSGDTYRVMAAARRIVEGALPANALSGLGPIQAEEGNGAEREEGNLWQANWTLRD